MPFKNRFIIQWGSENQISRFRMVNCVRILNGVRISNSVWFSNDPDHSKLDFWLAYTVLYKIKIMFLYRHFELSRFQMVGAIAIAHPFKSEPFKNRPPKCLVFEWAVFGSPLQTEMAIFCQVQWNIGYSNNGTVPVMFILASAIPMVFYSDAKSINTK